MELNEFINECFNFQFNTSFENIKQTFPHDSIDKLLKDLSENFNLDNIYDRDCAITFIKEWYWKTLDDMNKRRKRG